MSLLHFSFFFFYFLIILLWVHWRYILLTNITQILIIDFTNSVFSLFTFLESKRKKTNCSLKNDHLNLHHPALLLIHCPAHLALLHLAVVPLDLPTPLHTLRFREAVLWDVVVGPDQGTGGTAGHREQKKNYTITP